MIFVINLSLSFISPLSFSTRAHTLYGSALCPSLSLSLFMSITSLSLSHSLSYLSLPLYIFPSTFLSLSLLSIIIFGVSNGSFRPCSFENTIFRFKVLNQKPFYKVFIFILNERWRWSIEIYYSIFLRLLWQWILEDSLYSCIYWLSYQHLEESIFSNTN